MIVFFKSNFSARSCREVILRIVSDWSTSINDILKCRGDPVSLHDLMTASVGIAVVDELHNFDLLKCGKSSRRHRAVRSRRIREKVMRIDRNLPRKMHGDQAPKARKSRPYVLKAMH